MDIKSRREMLVPTPVLEEHHFHRSNETLIKQYTTGTISAAEELDKSGRTPHGTVISHAPGADRGSTSVNQ